MNGDLRSRNLILSKRSSVLCHNATAMQDFQLGIGKAVVLGRHKSTSAKDQIQGPWLVMDIMRALLSVPTERARSSEYL